MPQTDVELTADEQAWLAGKAGPARQLAVEMIVTAAEIASTRQLVAIEMAHINSCHWSGQLSVDFAEFFAADEVEFAVPTHTNASLIACESPGLRPHSEAPKAVAGARRLMQIYESLGCTPLWTCAPYHQPEGRPAFGAQVVGSESNAVSFFNSALGARTNKYGDLLDVCAALVGRVPLTGLHTDQGRLGTHLVRIELPDSALDDPRLHHVVGIIVGRVVGSAVPVIDGLPISDEDDLKALAAAAATSGAVAMFHAVGSTPEADTIDAATGGVPPRIETIIDAASWQHALDSLSSSSRRPLQAVCVGTPHFSVEEFAALVKALRNRHIDSGVRFIATTSRAVGHEIGLRGWSQRLADAGVEIVLDTCTYYTPRPRGVSGLVMTNSAKWAYYAPGTLDVDVAFADLATCVESAVAGRVVS